MLRRLRQWRPLYSWKTLKKVEKITEDAVLWEKEKKYMSTFVIGDIHGEYEQLKVLLAKMNFGKQDKLYVLGDLVDRGPDPIKTLQFLMRLSNCICLVGNHEFMAYMGMKILLKEVTEESVCDFAEEDQEKLKEWMLNGGAVTIADFVGLSREERKEVMEYLGNLETYVELEVNGQKYLMVHAGLGNFSEEKPMEEYTLDDLIWARADYSIPYYKDKIVITGHTPTQTIPDNPHPGCIYRANNHIVMDCGAGFKEGRLAGICLENGKEYYAKEN